MSDHEMTKLVVDSERCIGSGMCEMLEEAVFLINEDTNIAEVQGEGHVPADRALIVIDRCPSGAIAVAPDESPDSSEEQ